MRKFCVGSKFDPDQTFLPTFSDSSNAIFVLDWFAHSFIQHLDLITSIERQFEFSNKKSNKNHSKIFQTNKENSLIQNKNGQRRRNIIFSTKTKQINIQLRMNLRRKKQKYNSANRKNLLARINLTKRTRRNGMTTRR